MDLLVTFASILWGSSPLSSRQPLYNYYIVTPRQGRHAIRRKLLRELPARFEEQLNCDAG